MIHDAKLRRFIKAKCQTAAQVVREHNLPLHDL